MSVSTCIITGNILDPTGTAISGAVIKANLVSAFIDSNNNLLVQKEVNTTSNSSGVFSITLVQGSSQIVSIEYPPNSTDSDRRDTFSIVVPATPTANFYSLVTET